MTPGHRPSHRGQVSPILLGAGVLVLVVGGWATFRAATKAKESTAAETARAENPEPLTTPTTEGPSTTPTPAAAGSPPAPGAAISEAPTTASPVTREADLDDIVKKEAPKYGAPERPKAELVAVVVTDAGAGHPKEVAAEIDRIIDARLTADGIPASALADDAEFLRRAYLDITGCVPPVAKVRAFFAEQSPDKRARLIDDLLASHDYGDHFAHYWHELIVKRDADTNNAIQTHDVFQKWLTRQFNQNRPWDQIVRAMLTAEGDQALAGETFFILANAENGQPAPSKIISTAAALFLGNQLQCAECHVHPVVSDWKQQDFWGLAAFFGKTHAIRTGTARNPNDLLARITESGAGRGKDAATLPDGSIPIPDPRNEGKTIGAARAKLFGNGFAAVAPSSVNRGFVADWFVSPRNPYFARAAVNRMWSVFLGRGLINPLDDIRPDRAASHPELLERLAAEFIAAKFDTKHLIRCICRSAAYQRSSATSPRNKDDEELYSHMPLKVIPPRAMFISLGLITNQAVKSPREDHGGRNGEPADGFGFFDNREYDESPTEYTWGVPQLLRLMNTQLPQACDTVAKTLPKLGNTEKVVENLYLRTLARFPTPTESKKMATFVARHPDPVKGYSAALWVLLHSAEFFTNH